MKRGFTLIELLIVVGILAILTTAVILVLNPAQLIAESRDAQRLSDLASINSAAALYLTTATATISMGTTNYRTVSSTDTCPFSQNSGVCITNASTTVDGTGWMSAELTKTQGGSPLAKLPKDPLDNTNYYYAYAPDNTNKVYEIDARLESVKYRSKMTLDGGDKNTCSTWTENTCFFETGTDPGLDL